ncbi:D-alanine--D-alanine ligase [Streptomyces cinnamoneus]|uniref:D-alanine--D-alanine ligase family protein n=1 Tax=Streptomyces cinnamoneus TaxID=53446 RepID=UPI0033C767DB
MTEIPAIDGLRVGVLFGGASPERPGSVASAEAAAKAMNSIGAVPELIDLADAPWAELRERIDVALLASHGLGGEDGKVQGTLDTLRVRYTGSGVMASALGMHKPTFKRILCSEMIDTPKWVALNPELSTASTVSTVKYSLGFPVFFKPVSGGGSLEAGIAWDETGFWQLLERSKEHPYAAYMVEEYVPGRPCTVGVLEVEGELTVLPVHDVETDRPFYDYEAKHDLSLRREHCPSILPEQTTKLMQQLALRVHRRIGAHGLSRVDFMATESGRTTMLEINTVPGLSEAGNLATMARAGGMEYPVLLEHVLKTAFTKPPYVP